MLPKTTRTLAAGSEFRNSRRRRRRRRNRGSLTSGSGARSTPPADIYI